MRRPGRPGWDNGLRAAVRRRVAIDTRALAAFRMGLGALVLADLATRAPDLVAFYTDAGVVPRDALAAVAPTFGSLSIHALWGSAAAQAGLFVLAGLAAAALFAGYRTRLVTVVSFLLLISLHARNPVILNGGDSLLRHLLLWGVFLPLGERWSVDAVGRGRPRVAVASVATLGLLAQVVLVYATNAVLKLRGDAWIGGGAVEQVMALTRFSTWLGEALLAVPPILTLATYAWLALLVLSPAMLLATGPRRVVLPACLAAMHLGMALFMDLGLFPFVSIVALVPVLPAWVWDRVPTPESAGFERVAAGLLEPRLPTEGSICRRLPPVVEPAAVILLVGLLVVNAASVGLVAYPPGTPAALESKSWDMFAPVPPSDDGWYVAPATLASGGRVDALRGTPLSWDRPPDVDDTYANNRWQKLLYQLRWPPESTLKRPLAGYLCRQSTHDIVHLRLVYVEYPIDAPGSGDRLELGRFTCP